MFHKLVCLLFTCLTIVNSEFSQPANDSSIEPTLQTNRLPNSLMDSRRISFSDHKNRRGIVLVDEDFDIPSDKELDQRWKKVDPDGAELGTNSSLVISTEEGSGFDTILEVSSMATSSSNMKPEKLQMTSAEEKVASTQDTSDFEGSGEDISTQSIPPGTSTTKPKNTTSSIPKICLNFTCDSKEVAILQGISETVPEGTNLTLSCVRMNSTAQGILKWYKHVHNGTDELLVEDSSEVHHLIHNIPQARLPDSGMYVCLRFTEQSCCYRQMYVIVYEVPSYRYHLIVIGVVAAISLFTCVLLVICRNFKVRKYEEQLELQNMEKQLML